MNRLVAAAALLAGVASFALPATSQASECLSKACYQCVMYPCGPSDWVPYIEHRAQVIACDTAEVC